MFFINHVLKFKHQHSCLKVNEGTGKFPFNVLQLLFGFFSPYLRKVMQTVSFSLQAHITFNTRHSVYVEVMLVKLKILNEWLG
jgi:hypothetical protein